MVTPIRLGIVPFTNALPLLEGLDEKYDLFPVAPSRMVRLMQTGDLDGGLVPVFPLLDGAPWKVIPGVAIASDGPVKSVNLYTATPIPSIRRIACDDASMTSVNMLAVLLKKDWNLEPDLIAVDAAMGLHALDAGFDAVLLIGDAAIKASRFSKMTHVDLGQWWRAVMGVPFVYAVWAIRDHVAAGPLAEDLILARDKGLKKIPALARDAAVRIGGAIDEFVRYFNENIRYTLGPGELTGLQLFGRHLKNMGRIQGSGTVTLCRTDIPLVGPEASRMAGRQTGAPGRVEETRSS